jgi:hypothetical protein
MAIDVEHLAKRLADLERQVNALQQALQPPQCIETPVQRGAQLRRQAERRRADLLTLWDRSMEAMGVRGEPVPAARLRAMFAAQGFRPEDNVLSQELVAMREE